MKDSGDIEGDLGKGMHANLCFIFSSLVLPILTREDSERSDSALLHRPSSPDGLRLRTKIPHPVGGKRKLNICGKVIEIT